METPHGGSPIFPIPSEHIRQLPDPLQRLTYVCLNELVATDTPEPGETPFAQNTNLSILVATLEFGENSPIDVAARIVTEPETTDALSTRQALLFTDTLVQTWSAEDDPAMVATAFKLSLEPSWGRRLQLGLLAPAEVDAIDAIRRRTAERYMDVAYYQGTSTFPPDAASHARMQHAELMHSAAELLDGEKAADAAADWVHHMLEAYRIGNPKNELNFTNSVGNFPYRISQLQVGVQRLHTISDETRASLMATIQEAEAAYYAPDRRETARGTLAHLFGKLRRSQNNG